MQSHKESIIETALNIGSGFIIAWLATIYLLPLWGFETDVRTSFEITCFYTTISLIRSYAWRRTFNWFTIRRMNNGW